MRLTVRKRMGGAVWGAVALVLWSSAAALGQDAATGKSRSTPKLWVDDSTGQVFTRPGPGRTPLDLTEGVIDSGALQKQIEKQVEQKVEQKVDPKAQDALRQKQAEIETTTQILAKQVKEMEPGWQHYVDVWKDKIRIGTLFYSDYALYTSTGFGPQFMTQLNPPGPGNDLYSSFDVTRTYLNVFFTPTTDWTLRITPNVYRTLGSASNFKFGKQSGIGSNLDGEMGFRLKYGYLQYNSLFNDVAPLKGDTIQGGMIANPLVAWEEDLFGYRFVALTPWNYLSLSSTQVGVSVQGPVKFGGKQYLDYDVGVYNNASFRSLEQTDTKEAMARLSWYPFGADWRFDGLGITGFFNYGYGNTTPDNQTVATAFKGGREWITRIAALVHYTTEQWGVALEYDWGRNAFSGGNLFSGSGPADFFGVATTPFAEFASLVHALQDNGRAEQQGWSVLGHYHIPRTPLTLFGVFQEFEPNTKADKNPLDFYRVTAGVSVQINEYMRIAFSSQNLFYYHDQFDFPAAEAAKFGLPAKQIADAVPQDIHAIFVNVEFAF